LLISVKQVAGAQQTSTVRRLIGTVTSGGGDDASPNPGLAPHAVGPPVRMDLVADTAEDKARKTRYVDNGWPTTDPDDHAVSELVTDRTGALSPFGELAFPLPSTELPYLHPVTVVNR
jgi:hypothetical protein